MPREAINVGILLAVSPAAELERVGAFVRRLVEDTRSELERATHRRWDVHVEEPTRLQSDDPRRPSDYLDEASLRMAEGPFDAVIVVTDVGLVSRRQNVVAGLASPVSRIAVLSTRKLLVTPRGKSTRTLESDAVRWNAALLFLHLVGHLLGLRHHAGSDVMRPFHFDELRARTAGFTPAESATLMRQAHSIPERELRDAGWLRELAFHVASAGRHAGQVLGPILRSRAPVMALALPSLTTAAVVPTFILVFTAEIWDVGLNLGQNVAWTSAVASVLAAAWYMTGVLNLFFPRKEKRVVTEHMAAVNVSIFVTILLAVIGLFAMVMTLMLLVELYVFPAGLISTWPTLEDPVVDFVDKLRLALFISTVGVLTGALAGGLESRTVVRHLALFLDEP